MAPNKAFWGLFCILALSAGIDAGLSHQDSYDASADQAVKNKSSAHRSNQDFFAEQRKLRALEKDAKFLIFMAVLEGCYKQALSDEDLDLILKSKRDTSDLADRVYGEYGNFIYGCPICWPALNAFLTYRNRPMIDGSRAPMMIRQQREGMEKYAVLDATIQASLKSEFRGQRMTAIGKLIAPWVRARIDTLGKEQRKHYQAVWERAKTTSDDLIKQLEYRDLKGCAICVSVTELK